MSSYSDYSVFMPFDTSPYASQTTGVSNIFSTNNPLGITQKPTSKFTTQSGVAKVTGSLKPIVVSDGSAGGSFVSAQSSSSKDYARMLKKYYNDLETKTQAEKAEADARYAEAKSLADELLAKYRKSKGNQALVSAATEMAQDANIYDDEYTQALKNKEAYTIAERAQQLAQEQADAAASTGLGYNPNAAKMDTENRLAQSRRDIELQTKAKNAEEYASRLAQAQSILGQQTQGEQSLVQDLINLMGSRKSYSSDSDNQYLQLLMGMLK